MIKWLPKSGGKDRWYESECKRFSILPTHTTKKYESRWILFDRHDRNELDQPRGGFRDTLESAKQCAERLLARKAES